MERFYNFDAERTDETNTRARARARASFSIVLKCAAMPRPSAPSPRVRSTRLQSLVENLEVRYKATIVVPSITQTLFVIFFHTDMNIETF